MDIGAEQHAARIERLTLVDIGDVPGYDMVGTAAVEIGGVESGIRHVVRQAQAVVAARRLVGAEAECAEAQIVIAELVFEREAPIRNDAIIESDPLTGTTPSALRKSLPSPR